MSARPKQPRFLVSGGTGFLGKHVVPLLRQLGEVTCLSRSRPDCLAADLTAWDAGLEDPKTLEGRFDVFLHMAGLYDLRVGQLQAFQQNIGATHTALTLAEKAKIPHFVHISTFAVAIRSSSKVVHPDEINSSHAFPDFYSLSKARAEELVRSRGGAFRSKLILRLAALVGDSREGRIERIDGPYHCPETLRPLKSLLQKLPGPLPLPGHEGRGVPIAPVDAVAGAIVKLCELSRQQDWSGTRAFHLTPTRELTAAQLYRSTLRYLGLSQREVRLVSALPDYVLKEASARLAGLPREELEYLLNSPALDTSETIQLLGRDWCPQFEAYEGAFWKGYSDYVSNR
ncbi:MAG: SDR family oxidoreductase [Oligoflexia bacterium]|nr:SDR family oxidoreductase [Oligoflexia bacterium]